MHHQKESLNVVTVALSMTVLAQIHSKTITVRV